MKLGELVKISPGFQRSINLAYDLNNPDKIETYIPTNSAEEALAVILNPATSARDTATMILGSYGTGKSHFAVVVGSLLAKRTDSVHFYPLLERIERADVREFIQRELSVEEPFLVVPVSGGSKDVDSALLVALRNALAGAGISLELDTAFRKALSVLELWEKEYPTVFNQLNDMLVGTPYRNVYALRKALATFDRESLMFFRNTYPQLTAGAEFDPFFGRVVEIYEDVCRQLKGKGYRGLFLIFDEFNKTLDSQFDSADALKTIQDLAELSAHSGEDFQMNMTLLSHRTFGQYAAESTGALVDEWRKIEGRFRLLNFRSSPWQSYNLMSRVLIKKDDHWLSQYMGSNPTIRDIIEDSRLPLIFRGLPKERLHEITYGCFPLHPVSVYLLPRVSSLLAQNDRTVFTFLAGKDDSPVEAVLDIDLNGDQTPYVMPWQVYDYFELQMKHSSDPAIKGIWKKVTAAMRTLSDLSEKDGFVLKTVGVIQLLGGALPSSRRIVKYAVKPAMSEAEFETAVTKLLKKRVLLERQPTRDLELAEPTDFDIEKELEEVANWLRRSGDTINSSLREWGIEHYVLPYEYNHKFKITRFLDPMYADGAGLRTLLKSESGNAFSHSLDGVICYIYPETYSDLRACMDMVQKVDDPRVIFALPREPVNLNDAVVRVRALEELRTRTELVAEPRVRELLDMYYQDALAEVRRRVEQVSVPSKRVMYFWRGVMRRQILSEKQLCSLASDVMSYVYPDTPVVNNELINRDRPSRTSQRALNNVIDALLSPGESAPDNLNSAQERFMFDTLFVQTGLFEGGGANPTVARILNTIDEFFAGAEEKLVPFTGLVKELLAPPIGLRRGVLPVFLTVAVLKYKENLTIRDERDLDCLIDAELLEKIVSAPDKYRVRLDDWNEAACKLTEKYKQMFLPAGAPTSFFANQFGILGEAVFHWLLTLPKYARETTTISQNARTLRRYARLAASNAKQVLLVDLPRKLGFESYTVDDVEQLVQVINDARVELQNKLAVLKDRVRHHIETFLRDYGVPGESLTSRARNLAEGFNRDGVTSLDWVNVIDYLNGFRGDESELVEGMARIITGVRMEDWNDETEQVFIESLAQLREHSSRSDRAGKRVELLFVESADGKKRAVVHECEIGALAETLQMHIESSIRNFGESITQGEKKQILLNILRKMLGDTDEDRVS